MPVPIETYQDEASIDTRVTLDGVDYGLRVDYSQSEDRYRIALSLTDGTKVVQGVKVVPSVDLLSSVRNPSAPSGLLICSAPNYDDTPPGYGELGVGKRCTLTYYTVEELDAVRS